MRDVLLSNFKNFTDLRCLRNRYRRTPCYGDHICAHPAYLAHNKSQMVDARVVDRLYLHGCGFGYNHILRPQGWCAQCGGAQTLHGYSTFGAVLRYSDLRI